jgi:hypothetical protein
VLVQQTTPALGGVLDVGGRHQRAQVHALLTVLDAMFPHLRVRVEGDF